MAARRVYGGSKAVLLQNDGFSSEALEAMLASASSSGAFHGSRSMLNFEEIHRDMPKRTFYGSLDLEGTGEEDMDDCFQQPEKKRRLAPNQVQFLEKTFEIENKLEPERKIQLAKDLGLQPRQVAIWFQNRRARWKTKQLEKDYEDLKSSYNVLKADYENLLNEKERLTAEVLVLTDKLHLKEKNASQESTEANNAPTMNPEQESASSSVLKRSDTPVIICKLEDLSCANSAVSDLDSPRCTNGTQTSLFKLADSSNAFEADRPDLPHVDEDEEIKACSFLKIEDNQCNYGFPVEDQALWFWPY